MTKVSMTLQYPKTLGDAAVVRLEQIWKAIELGHLIASDFKYRGALQSWRASAAGIIAKASLKHDLGQLASRPADYGQMEDVVEGGNWHPDWNKVMADCGGADKRANELVMVTRETAQIAAHAIASQQKEDAYDNRTAAHRELIGVLADD